MNNIEPALAVIVVGFVVILYFWLKPKSEPKLDDGLINPIQVEGLPPSYPMDPGGDGGGLV